MFIEPRPPGYSSPRRGEMFIDTPAFSFLIALLGAECETAMANTYSQIYIQTVYTVEGRLSLIQPEFKEHLYKIHHRHRHEPGPKTDLNHGMSDHLHILIGLRPAMALADLVREIKADSSNFINRNKWVHGRFSWQEGYGAFSYGHSQLDTIIRYIQNQEQHHKRSSFKNEYLTLLRKFDIAFEDKYVFKFIE